ncbi:DUF2059 domain-containing protein (plasmid) [Ralstonia syzygii subsp. celebesensis]|uniref:DUF2059 domain-containing protein n=2 Tax=Ralstonia solanacearum species complex TaxID=3116862 RepID=A0AAD0SBV2_RALSL|nr:MULTISPECIES: DUF2059 domain-containing protein [Ralstonia solanacearum species complex]CCA82846.1 conserved exported hypothetical protein [blood disease bacterium R229]AXV84556.1 DUF2059 domain-containing protein [Ralstonia solanacearum]AXW55681.1 DUF2059 domain-containing protein [Ralstonia solanacearum]QQV57466.1 DUF2059 domain-containing protein [Ralstonia syzygii subsp. celebesensis]CBJ35973.1 conserved exported protein of unknown function [Ralstonia solanacearum PSI07]
MIRNLIAMAVGIALSTSVAAADRTEKIQKLMQAQGLSQMFEQQIASGREFSRKQADRMMAQVLAGMNADAAYRKRFKDAMEAFIADMQPSWSAGEMVAIWSRLFGAKFTDEELDQLIAFYTSPLGQKEVAASRDALPAFNQLFQARYKPIQERATTAFLQRIQQLKTECRCDK